MLLYRRVRKSSCKSFNYPMLIISTPPPAPSFLPFRPVTTIFCTKQELSIVLSSEWSDKNVVFEKDMFKDDAIMAEADVSSPEWLICKHVHTDVDSQVTKLPGPPSDVAQPLYVIRCHVIRKPWHYFWNIALLMVSGGCVWIG